MARNAPPDGPGSEGTPIRRILWISFFLAVFIYGVVGYLLFVPAAASRPLVPDWIWAVIALVMAGAAFWLPRSVPPGSAGTPSGLRTPELVGWSAAEAVAVVGLVSVSVGAKPIYLIICLVVAAVILWLQRPTD